MKFKRFTMFALALVVLASSASVYGQQSRLSSRRGMRVEAVEARVESHINDYSQKAVFVDVDRKDRVYYEDDLVVTTVRSDTDGYLYLIHVDIEGRSTVLFPNEWFNDNRIKANQTVQYPTPNDPYVFRVTGPDFGKEKIVACVTQKELKSIDPANFNVGGARTLDDSEQKALIDELEELDKNAKRIVSQGKPNGSESSEASNDADYAQHYVEIETKKRGATTPKPKKVFAVCIGINNYLSPQIKNLSGCDSDAKKMAEVFQKCCGVAEKDCVVLCDEEVTLANVRKVFVDILPRKTAPGDVVYIFWSGHGDSTKGAKNESNSDKSEYLVPYDADISSSSKHRETLIHEDAFGAWVRLLSGRKVLVFLDACYSGGMANNAKSTTISDFDDDDEGFAEAVGKLLSNGSDASKSVDGWEPFQFGTKTFSRSKALGQNDLYVLASSTSDQPSKVRVEGDMSVMTYCLADVVKNGSSNLTHKDLRARVEKGVNEYMKEYYPEAKQSVVEQDDLYPALRLKK